jgi:hypothetical protein
MDLFLLVDPAGKEYSSETHGSDEKYDRAHKGKGICTAYVAVDAKNGQQKRDKSEKSVQHLKSPPIV